MEPRLHTTQNNTRAYPSIRNAFSLLDRGTLLAKLVVFQSGEESDGGGEASSSTFQLCKAVSQQGQVLQSKEEEKSNSNSTVSKFSSFPSATNVPFQSVVELQSNFPQEATRTGPYGDGGSG